MIGAGLSGSLMAALLRNDFKVTLVEQGRKRRPLFDDIDCANGEVNTSINRAEGMGGTTNYWHNALIELDDTDLRKAGIEPRPFEPYYSKAWSFFLSESELAECKRARDTNEAAVRGTGCTIAHMVLPQTRHNMWELANQRLPGNPIEIVHGRAERIVPAKNGTPAHVVLQGKAGEQKLAADYFLVCAGGLSTPVLLSRSTDPGRTFTAGYHDHPMAYVAKVKLRSESRLKAISCTTTQSAEVRAGIIYETAGLKTVVYLRPAIDMRMSSITGNARYILSDLRNDPFSLKKIVQLLSNLEAVREAILFKTRSGFRGDYYSVLIFGEQTPIETRGLTLEAGKRPMLNWHVTESERASYAASVETFLAEFSGDILEHNVLPEADWEFRTAAHHSGTAHPFLSSPGATTLDFHAAKGLPGTFVCDGSQLQAAGIANSGLTLVALGYRLAELLRAAG